MDDLKFCWFYCKIWLNLSKDDCHFVLFLYLPMHDHHFGWKQKLLKKHGYLLRIVFVYLQLMFGTRQFPKGLAEKKRKKIYWYLSKLINCWKNQTPLGYYNKYTIKGVLCISCGITSNFCLQLLTSNFTLAIQCKHHIYELITSNFTLAIQYKHHIYAKKWTSTWSV